MRTKTFPILQIILFALRSLISNKFRFPVAQALVGGKEVNIESQHSSNVEISIFSTTDGFPYTRRSILKEERCSGTIVNKNFILMTLFCASNSLEFPCAFHTLMTLISGNLITIHITQVCKICAIYK